MKLTIVGAGPAGRYAAVTAAEKGADVVLIDERGEKGVGGKCLPNASTPLGALVEAARIVLAARRIPGVEDPDVDAESVFKSVKKGIERIREMLLEEVESAGVELKKASADRVEEGPVLITDRGEFESDAVLLCTGSEPIVPDVEGVDLDDVHVVTDLVYVEPPSSAAIVGDEPFALEAAYALAGLGVDTTLLTVNEPLPDFPDGLRSRALEDLQEVGVDVENLGNPSSFEEGTGGIVVEGTEGSAGPFDSVFLALGLKPRSDIADRSGLDMDGNGAVIVDGRMRTSMDGVYAAGDVTGPPYLTSVARYEGVVAALSALSMDVERGDPPVPRAVRLSRDHCVVDGVEVTDACGPTPAGGPSFWMMMAGRTGWFEIKDGLVSVSAPCASVAVQYLPYVAPSGDIVGVHPTPDPFPEVLRWFGLKKGR